MFFDHLKFVVDWFIHGSIMEKDLQLVSLLKIIRDLAIMLIL